MRTPTKYQKLWYKAIFLTISRNVRKKIQHAEVEKDLTPAQLEHLNWRLALSLFNGYRFKEAMKLLEELTTERPITPADTNNSSAAAVSTKTSKKRKSVKDRAGQYVKNSFVNQTAGRCATQLFLEKEEHFHLEKAHYFYQMAVENMEVNLFTMFKLPELLLEFGIILERYGAFEAANEVYGRILSGFPNFRGYFDALYRTAIVGRHLASLLKNTKAKEDMYNKSIDILQFLIEALPAHISEVQILMLYGRTLELSSNRQVRFRAHAIYRTLFEICSKKRIANANLASGDAAKWLEDPQTWHMLADLMAQEGESLIAKDGYEKFMELKAKYKAFDKDVHEELDIHTCLKLARSAALYQNYSAAIRYAEMGLKIDRYDAGVRKQLEKWSESHRKSFQHEKQALEKIVSVWKDRCWTVGFRTHLKEKMIADMEERYEKNRWDVEAREHLQYYARDKYRSKFLFEGECILRLQRFFRQRKKHWIWQEVQRQHHYSRAAEVYRRYQRHPRNTEIRKELVEISQHRMAPRKHPIQFARKQIEIENNAVYGIERCMACYKMRSNVLRLIQLRKNRIANQRFLAARTIQCAIRMTLAIKVFNERYDERQRQHIAARIIQQFIRSRNRSMFHLVKSAIHMKANKIQRAKNVLRRRLPQAIGNYFARKEAKAIAAELREARDRKRREEKEKEIARERAALKIQHFCRKCINKFWSKISIAVIKARRAATFSYPALDHIALLDKQEQLQGSFTGGKGIKEVHVTYQCPGINSNSSQFQQLLHQETVIIQGHFDAADCMMLALVLRHVGCKIKTIVMRRIINSLDACFEFDLIPALSKCRSIRSIYLYGGEWTIGLLTALIKLVQVENSRITTLAIEKLDTPGLKCETVSNHAGYLLCDYFNYSAPGIVELSLHGCAMRDVDVELISNGLAVNSSIRRVCLSLNLISDIGFIAIFGAICRNKNSQVEKLDFNWNLIQCNREMRNMLRYYKAHRLNIFMELHLLFNRIYDRYHPVQDLRRKGDTQVLRIFYTPEEVEESKNITVRYQKKQVEEKTKKNIFNSSHESQGSLKHRMRQLVLSPLQDNINEMKLMSKTMPRSLSKTNHFSSTSVSTKVSTRSKGKLYSEVKVSRSGHTNADLRPTSSIDSEITMRSYNGPNPL